MALITAPTLPIREIEWYLDQPAQVNRGGYSGSRVVVSNPWHGKWRAKVTLATQQGEANFRTLRSFLTSLKGQVNTFLLPATEPNQITITPATLDLNFSTGVYQNQGTSYALTAMPGYSYTRTGPVSYYNGNGTTNVIDNFAANVAPVVSNSVGYEAYGALTNSVANSQAFDTWTANNTTVTANNATAPDGTATADQIVATATGASASRYAAGGSQTANTPVTVSAILKAGSAHIAYLGFELADPPAFCYFDLQAGAASTIVAGTMTGVTSGIQSYGNGWYRCWMEATPGTSGACNAYVGVADAAGSESVTANDSIYAWQGQLIAGAESGGGPLIETSGAAGSIGAPTMSMNCPNGTYNATYTFDDNSTQTISTTISGGVFTMPTVGTLNRPTVKHVVLATGATASPTVNAAASQGATSITLSNNPGLLAGMRATITLPSGNQQMVELTADASGTTMNFEPALREAVAVGAAVEVANPGCMVALAQSENGYSVGQWRRYDMSFDVEEAF